MTRLKTSALFALLSLLLAALAACGPAAPSGGEPAPPQGSGSAPSAPTPPADADVQTGYAFAVEPLPAGEALTELLTFHPNSRAKPGYLIDIPEGAMLTQGGNTDWQTDYSVTLPDSEGAMVIELLSCPDGALRFFGLETQAELDNKLLAYLFSTADRHAGQQRAVDYFGYTLLADYSGEREGQAAFLVEFEAPQDGMRSVRFLSANDEMGEDYAGVSVRIDLPAGENAALADFMAILASLRRAEG